MIRCACRKCSAARAQFLAVLATSPAAEWATSSTAARISKPVSPLTGAGRNCEDATSLSKATAVSSTTRNSASDNLARPGANQAKVNRRSRLGGIRLRSPWPSSAARSACPAFAWACVASQSRCASQQRDRVRRRPGFQTLEPGRRIERLQNGLVQPPFVGAAGLASSAGVGPDLLKDSLDGRSDEDCADLNGLG